jgi:hypothetical protein
MPFIQISEWVANLYAGRSYITVQLVPGCSRDCLEICRDIRSYLKVSEPGSPGFRTLEALRYRAGLAFRFNAKLTQIASQA